MGKTSKQMATELAALRKYVEDTRAFVLAKMSESEDTYLDGQYAAYTDVLNRLDTPKTGA
jgi:hypothetical protein